MCTTDVLLLSNLANSHSSSRSTSTVCNTSAGFQLFHIHYLPQEPMKKVQILPWAEQREEQGRKSEKSPLAGHTGQGHWSSTAIHPAASRCLC